MVSLSSFLDIPSLFFGGTNEAEILAEALANRMPLPGHYAFARKVGEDILLARDPVGCNKLFYCRRPGGDYWIANRVQRLLDEGAAVGEIFSVPPGRLARLTAAGVRIEGGGDVSEIQAADDFDLARLRRDVAAGLEDAIRTVGRNHQGARFVVCLSGGLDSTIVASLAARHLPDVTAASFSFLPADQANGLARGDVPLDNEALSDDFRKARLVAQRLGMDFLPVLRVPSAVAEALPIAVRLGQDWRDFNVHAAVVNVFLAQELRARFSGQKVLVLTGDIMNELVCDYREEVVDGQVYYPQPRVGLARRRRFFVRGLDAGDREMGVFTGYGLDLCQPYASVAHHYMTVPAGLLEKEDAKWTLNAHMLPEALRDLVSAGKTRAQVGGKDQGVLGLCHRLGIRQNDLERLWCRQVSQADDRTALDLIQFGRYRLADRN